MEQHHRQMQTLTTSLCDDGVKLIFKYVEKKCFFSLVVVIIEFVSWCIRNGFRISVKNEKRANARMHILLFFFFNRQM